MARDGLLPRSFFAAVHPRFRTPHKSTILTGVIVAIIAALFPIHALAEMVNIGTLFAFVVVCASVWIMRVTNPDQPRPFRCPLVPIVPILGILFNGGLMLSLGWHNWARLGLWLVIGLAIYFAYGRHHSKVAAAAH
jgi:APA family basic amino acid/polyamine antiporter